MMYIEVISSKMILTIVVIFLKLYLWIYMVILRSLLCFTRLIFVLDYIHSFDFHWSLGSLDFFSSQLFLLCLQHCFVYITSFIYIFCIATFFYYKNTLLQRWSQYSLFIPLCFLWPNVWTFDVRSCDIYFTFDFKFILNIMFYQ